MSERTILVLLGLFLVIRAVTLPIHPLIDDSEARYAIVAKEMADSGDWITPRVWYHGEHVSFLGKPPLHFWAAALCIHLFGANEFAVRLPSLVGAVFLVILMWVILRKYVEIDIAHSAVLIVSSCVQFFVLAGAVVVDMTLALCVTGSVLSYQAFLMDIARSQKRLWSLSVFIFLGLGFLTKGPVAVVMFGIPVFLWTFIHKQWATLRDHGWGIGILVFLALTVPWFWLAEIRNPGFLKYFFLNENLLRFVTREYGDLYGKGHVQPYGAAFVMLLLTGLPWTLWCAILLFRKKSREWFIGSLKDKRISMFTLSLAGITLFLCFTRQPLLSYVLPVLPFFAIWGAILLRKSEITKKVIARISIAVIVFYGMAYPLILPQVEHRYSAKGVVRLAREVTARLSLDGGLIFAGKVPFSAYFYGQDLILLYDKDDTIQNFIRGLNSGKRHLYVMKQHYQAVAPPRLLDKLKLVCIFGDWMLYQDAQTPLTKDLTHERY